MDEHQPGYPPARTDHDRIVTSGAWTGAIVFMLAFGWLDTKMPAWAGFALDWTAILAVCYAMACWKRAWYAWAAFWGMAVTCLLCGALALAGVTSNQWSAASWVLACVMVSIWYWLIRMPRKHPAVLAALERHEIHVFHHIVHHGPQLPGWTAAEITTETAAPIPAPARKVIAGTAIRAIEPARKARGALVIAASRIKALGPAQRHREGDPL
jgi:hypothetical protein